MNYERISPDWKPLTDILEQVGAKVEWAGDGPGLIFTLLGRRVAVSAYEEYGGAYLSAAVTPVAASTTPDTQSRPPE